MRWSVLFEKQNGESRYFVRLILKGDRLKLDHFQKQLQLQRPPGAVSSTLFTDT